MNLHRSDFLQRSLPTCVGFGFLTVALGYNVEAAIADDFSTQPNPTPAIDAFEQVTSVSQLTDVKPTDWAFQALQSLMERYGCIVGYPDKTYRGNRALSRYEFAAGLNACLDKIQEFIAAATTDFVKKADLETVKALQKQFAAELATIRGRVEALEVRTATLEKQQFSTTTKLSGQVIFAVASPFGFDDNRSVVQANLKTPVANNNQATFSDVVQLTLKSSFTGKDLLKMTLLGFNVQSFSISPIGPSYKPGDGIPNNSIVIDNLFYSFSVTDWLTANIYASGAGPADIVSTTISPLNDSAQGAVSGFSFPPQYQYNSPTTGAGASFNLKLGQNWVWDFGYVSAVVPNQPRPGAGLFNGSYTLNTQLNYLSQGLDFSLYYANSYLNSLFGNPLLVGQAGYDTVLPGQSTKQISNIYGTQFNFKFGSQQQFNLGGGFAYASIQGIGSRPDYDAWSYQGTFAWNTSNGSQLGILVGVPPYTRDLTGQSTATSFIAEIYYRYRVNDNISVTPSLIRQVNPYNVDSNPGAWIGTIRTTFTF